jgi:hypothetical protein
MSQVLRFRDNNYDVPRSVAFLPFILYVQIVMDVYRSLCVHNWQWWHIAGCGSRSKPSGSCHSLFYCQRASRSAEYIDGLLVYAREK